MLFRLFLDGPPGPPPLAVVVVAVVVVVVPVAAVVVVAAGAVGDAGESGIVPEALPGAEGAALVGVAALIETNTDLKINLKFKNRARVSNLYGFVRFICFGTYFWPSAGLLYYC